MCTLSWHFDAKGYDLFFNRDELNTRVPELEPNVQEWAGVSHLAPRDGDQGGTWLLTNEYGLSVALLNDYANSWRPAPDLASFSRGHVVQSCAAARSHADVWAAVEQCPLSAVKAFHLVALSFEEGPLVLHWAGRLRQEAGWEVTSPVSSSSYATREVVDARLHYFRGAVHSPGLLGVAELAACHRQHDPRTGAYSVLMRRPDAATRSISHVRVDASRVALTYSAVTWEGDQPIFKTSRHALARKSAALWAEESEPAMEEA